MCKVLVAIPEKKNHCIYIRSISYIISEFVSCVQHTFHTQDIHAEKC